MSVDSFYGCLLGLHAPSFCCCCDVLFRVCVCVRVLHLSLYIAFF